MNSKKQAYAARMRRATRSLLRSNGVAVIHLEPSGDQFLFSLKTLKMIQGGPMLAAGICDYPHHWEIYCAGLCEPKDGERYVKPMSFAPNGQYRSDDLVGVIEEGIGEVIASCNPNHLTGTAWIATPYPFDIDDDLARKIFAKVGAWSQVKPLDAL